MQGTHLTVGGIISKLLPAGSRHNRKSKKWDMCPVWAPDVFAVCATLVTMSGCYAEPGLILSTTLHERRQKLKRREIAEEEGDKWAESPILTPRRVELWSTLIKSRKEFVCSGSGKGRDWKRAALLLLAIADEACSGIGYFSEEDSGICDFALGEFIKHSKRAACALHLPNSLTHMVPPDVACVLPKAMTPDVGCTVRSLSHHLALLPSVGVVQTEWSITPPDRVWSTGAPVSARDCNSLNILLVPFPFVVRGTDFKVAQQAQKIKVDGKPDQIVDGYFSIKQDWLKNGRRALSVGDLGNVVLQLISESRRDVDSVQGVIFPEAALNRKLAVGVARFLARRCKSLEFFICGSLTDNKPFKRNEAIVFRMRSGELISSRQSKHHRWRLNEKQLLQYQLGGNLDPQFTWWERIDLHDRKIEFTVDGREAVIAALVCEDLARHEPVLPVVSAIGPSLLVALLLDGPQLKTRWSAKYATVLAEDPGSSILTLTCLGMIRRSLPPGGQSRDIIGLWKDREGDAIELELPRDAHGLVLSLNSRSQEQKTLDLRTDGGMMVEYRLGGIHAVAMPNPPKWLQRTA